MAISISKNTPLPKARPVDGQDQGKSSLFKKLVQTVAVSSLFERSRKITEKDRIFLFSQLALMFEAGTPLNVSLSAIKTQIKAPFFRGVIEDLVKSVEEGKSLSSAMTKHEREFPSATASMMKAGEASGSLGEMLNQAANLEKKKEEFRSMVQRAMAYPLFLMVLCFGVLVFVLTFVFPKFADLFANIWEILPVPTKVLMGTSRLVLDYWYVILIGLPALLLIFLNVLRRQKVKAYIDRLKITVPIVGKLFVMAYTSEMLRTLGFLLRGGVPLLEALTIVRETSRNILYQGFIGNIIEAAKEGKGISYTFLQTEFIPETVKQVIKTGEDSGKLDSVMVRLSDYYDDELEKQFKLLSTVIEPAALLIMGVVVAFVIMALVLPIFKLSRAIH